MLPRNPSTATSLLRACLLAIVALAFLPANSSADVAPLTATLEDGSFAEFSQTNVETGRLALAVNRAYDGRSSAKATYSGGGENGYSRGIWNVRWEDEDDVWFGATYFLPRGFHSQIQGQVDLMRWDNWASHPSDTDWGGVSIYGSDRRARLLRFGAGRPNDTLVGPIDLPEGRWFTLEVHQRLSSGDHAYSELYVNGRSVGNSTKPNTYGRAIERIRYGIVAIAEDDQRKPLDLWFDRATAGPETAGQIAAPRVPTNRKAATSSRCAQRKRGRGQSPACRRARVAVAVARVAR